MQISQHTLSNWSKPARLLGALLTVAAILTACGASTPEEKEAAAKADVEYSSEHSKLIAIVDGCRIWEVFRPYGENPVLARCPEGAADTQHRYRSGKTEKTQFTLGEN